MGKITIIIPTFRESYHIAAVLRDFSLQNTSGFSVIIVNANPNDETSDIIKKWKGNIQVKEVQVNANNFWAGSTAIGLNTALKTVGRESDGFLFANCDIRFKTNFIKTIQKASDKKPNSLFCCAAVSGKHYVTSGVKMKSWALSLTRHIPTGKLNGRTSPEFVSADMLAGRALFIPTEVPKEIGLPAATILPHYGADYEYTARAKRSGYNLYVYTGTVVESDVKNTGSKAYHCGATLWERLKLLFSKRSPSNLLYRVRFVVTVYPIAAVLPGICSIIVKTFAEVFFGRALYKRVARHHLYSD